MTDSEKALTAEALAHYRLASPQTEFIRHNENITCRIMDGSDTYVLRIRRPTEGFSLKIFGNKATAQQLMRGETELLLHLARADLFPVQVPVFTKDGEPVCLLSDGSPACLLRWIEGEPLTSEDGGLYARALGRLAARIHKAAKGFAGIRLRYSHDLVSAMRVELSAALNADHITGTHASACRYALDEIDAVMTRLDVIPDSEGLIHSDLGFANILRTPDVLAPIDFSLSGYGYKAQECGMIATNYSDPAQQRAVYEGYAEAGGVPADPHHTDAFFALSVLLFIVCQHERFYREEWFAKAMDRWCDTCFTPLTGQTVQRIPRASEFSA